MDKVIEKSLELQENLKNTREMQEFLKLKQLFENDAELEQMRKDIALAKAENRLEDHKALKEKYENHPLVVNYYQAKEEAFALLAQVGDIIKLD